MLESCNKELHSQYKGRPPLFHDSKCRVLWNVLFPNEVGGAYGYAERHYSS